MPTVADVPWVGLWGHEASIPEQCIESLMRVKALRGVYEVKVTCGEREGYLGHEIYWERRITPPDYI
jgi:hypothetical protein